MAEYSACYGGPPDAGMPWPLFLALVNRAPMFHAREQFAVALGIGAAFSGGTKELLPHAWPVKKARPKWIKNTLAPDYEPEEEGDGEA